MTITWENLLFSQVIDYCTLPIGDRVAEERRALIRNMWTQRIEGVKSNVEVNIFNPWKCICMLKHYLWVRFQRNVISIFRDFWWIHILFCSSENNGNCLFQGYTLEIMVRERLWWWVVLINDFPWVDNYHSV